MTILWIWLCFVQQQLSLGWTCVHAHSPALACHRTEQTTACKEEPEELGCPLKLSPRSLLRGLCLCAREGGEKET